MQPLRKGSKQVVREVESRSLKYYVQSAMRTATTKASPAQLQFAQTDAITDITSKGGCMHGDKSIVHTQDAEWVGPHTRPHSLSITHPAVSSSSGVTPLGGTAGT